VEVRIVTDDGRSTTYPVSFRSGLKKVYAEAVKGDHYRIEIKNKLNRKVGVVVAVDGRNIISGEKSFLNNSERMYILDPYESGSFAGWRTSNERINRFYFTDVPDSYAAAFGDESAMGVITVAAYPEVRRYEPPMPMSQLGRHDFENKGASSGAALDRSASAPSAPSPAGENMKKKAAKQEKAMESAGTGYGREEYSPVHTVAFEAERKAIETIHVKYEWRATLCKLEWYAAICHHSDRPTGCGIMVAMLRHLRAVRSIPEIQNAPLPIGSGAFCCLVRVNLSVTRVQSPNLTFRPSHPL
jgi:hypothetical protein